jgi:hypothetical protein
MCDQMRQPSDAARAPEDTLRTDIKAHYTVTCSSLGLREDKLPVPTCEVEF